MILADYVNLHGRAASAGPHVRVCVCVPFDLSLKPVFPCKQARSNPHPAARPPSLAECRQEYGEQQVYA